MDTKRFSGDVESKSVGQVDEEDQRNGDYGWSKRELQEHFQFGPKFFGMENPFEKEVVEVNASVLTMLLL